MAAGALDVLGGLAALLDSRIQLHKHASLLSGAAADVAAAVAILDMPTITLARTDLASGAEALLAGAIALQLLTVELATALDTNPDLIRREQPLYREVAEAAKAG